MQLKFNKLIYYQIKEIVERRYERGYLIKHILEMIAFFVMLIRGSLAIGTYWMKTDTFQYWQYDPWTYYIFVHHEKTFLVYAFIMMVPFFYGFSCAHTFFFHRVDTLTYRIFYDLIVVNIDQLNLALVSKRRQLELFDDNYKNNLKKFKQISILWQIPPIRFLLKQICWHSTKTEFSFSPKIINKVKISKCKLNSVPNITVEFRLKIAHIIYKLENFYFLFHILIGIFFN